MGGNLRFPCDNFTICARKVSWNKGLRLNQQTLFSKGLGGQYPCSLADAKRARPRVLYNYFPVPNQPNCQEHKYPPFSLRIVLLWFLLYHMIVDNIMATELKTAISTSGADGGFEIVSIALLASHSSRKNTATIFRWVLGINASAWSRFVSGRKWSAGYRI